MKKIGNLFFKRHILFLVTLSLFKPTSGTSSLNIEGYDQNFAYLKDEITNNTDTESILENSSTTIIQLMLKTHQSEMKNMMKKVDSLESSVKVLNDRVGKQEKEIFVLKSIVNHHQKKKREKRGEEEEKRKIDSTVLCPIGACAFDTKKATSSLAVYRKPANCEDLKSLGHTLNGFYLVQGKRDNITLKSKVETIYCDFYKRRSSGNLTGTITESIGYIDTRSSIRGIQFYVQRNIPLTGKSVNVNFQVERLNQGGAMDLSQESSLLQYLAPTSSSSQQSKAEIQTWELRSIFTTTTSLLPLLMAPQSIVQHLPCNLYLS